MHIICDAPDSFAIINLYLALMEISHG
jgi:hypothetical protein